MNPIALPRPTLPPRRQLLLAGLALACPASWAQTATKPGNAACPAFLQHRFDRLQDEKPQDLCQYAGRVLLVVNTASFCGFTSQYKDLEALHARYRDQGLVVLGFPSNDFGQQEPGSNQAIADFCESTFGVRFPMFVKSHVVGDDANPLFKQLASATGERPRWNFHKYLVSRDGREVKSHGSATQPNNPKFLKDLERFLSTKS